VCMGERRENEILRKRKGQEGRHPGGGKGISRCVKGRRFLEPQQQVRLKYIDKAFRKKKFITQK